MVVKDILLEACCGNCQQREPTQNTGMPGWLHCTAHSRNKGNCIPKHAVFLSPFRKACEHHTPEPSPSLF